MALGELLSNENGKLILGALYVLLEYFLGKTDKVKAGSTLELFLDAGSYLLKGKSKIE